MYRRFLAGAAVSLLLAPSAAFAAHGKVGLWNTTTTTNMAMSMPPEVQEQMKQAGVNMPSAHSFTSQMCMSQEEVNSDRPPHIDRQETGCDTHVTRLQGSSMTAEMVCNGSMKGTGHIQVSYNGAEHYQGSYDFKGSVEGNPTSLNSSFKGDWVKADCGAIKPYKLRTQ